MCIKKINVHKKIECTCKIYFIQLLNSVQQKFGYSIKLWLYDNRMKSSN